MSFSLFHVVPDASVHLANGMEGVAAERRENRVSGLRRPPECQALCRVLDVSCPLSPPQNSEVLPEGKCRAKDVDLVGRVQSHTSVTSKPVFMPLFRCGCHLKKGAPFFFPEKKVNFPTWFSK